MENYAAKRVWWFIYYHTLYYLYSQLKGTVVTKKWKTDTFSFANGIFTGDTYSPIIFNTTFQPLIDYIKNKKADVGYNLGGRRVVTKPFADDIGILTSNKKIHQNLQNEVQLKATSMGLTFKPSKCRSLSICSGTPKSVQFFLTDPETGAKVGMKTLEDDPHKFLGTTVSFHNNPKDHLIVLREKLSSKLNNLDKTLVRPEYKLAEKYKYTIYYFKL